jgi:hypothetical protein
MQRVRLVCYVAVVFGPCQPFGCNQTARASLALGYLKDERVHLNSPPESFSVAWNSRRSRQEDECFVFFFFVFLYSQKFSFKIKSPTVGKAKRKKESEVLNVLEVRK